MAVSGFNKRIYIKFILLCCLLGGYFAYLSYEYNLLTGGIAALLTWSFFVLCTPVADAGFMLDFPLRLLFGIRMIWSEIMVWIIAFVINIMTYVYAPNYYDTTLVTQTFYKILTTPYPYWGIIGLSCIGTFLSIRFGDEMMDVVQSLQMSTLIHGSLALVLRTDSKPTKRKVSCGWGLPLVGNNLT